MKLIAILLSLIIIYNPPLFAKFNVHTIEDKKKSNPKIDGDTSTYGVDEMPKPEVKFEKDEKGNLTIKAENTSRKRGPKEKRLITIGNICLLAAGLMLILFSARGA